MIFNSPEEVLENLITAYYKKRDINNILECLSDDVEWVGTENNDSAKGKKELKKILEKNIITFPDSFEIQLDSLSKQVLSSNSVIITMTGRQIATTNGNTGFIIRGTVCCVKNNDSWQIVNVHISVPNSEQEKYNLQCKLNTKLKQEQVLLASVRGGVAIYRLKKDGRISLDYATDGLAKMFGYDNAIDFIDYCKHDIRINVANNDMPLLNEALNNGLINKEPISVIYHCHVLGSQDILQRMDANIIEAKLEDDDVALLYAMHTIVSEDTKKKLSDLKQLRELVDKVPCGIGIYEFVDESIHLNYLNDSYYKNLGVSRKEREKYLGNSVLKAVHEDDHHVIIDMIPKLLAGNNNDSGVIRIKNQYNDWLYYNIAVSVVERNNNCIKAYVAYTNCDELIRLQQLKVEKYEEQLRLQKLGTQGAFSVGTFNLTKNLILESQSQSKEINNNLDNKNIDELFNNIWKDINGACNFPKNCKEMLKRYQKGENHFSIRYCMKNDYRWIESVFDLITNPYTGDVEATGVMLDVTNNVRSELVVSKLLEIDYDSIATINIETGIATPFTISTNELGMGKVLDVQENTSNMVKGLEEFFRAYCKSEDVEQVIYENSMPVILEALENKPFYESVYSINFGKGNEHKRVIYAYLDNSKSYLICAVQNFTATYDKEEKQKMILSKALQEAKKANIAKTSFLSRVSHDMRTPLNGILGITALLKDTISDEGALRDLSELEMSGQYLLELINDTLDMSRIESGKLELHPIVYDGKTMFDNTISLARSSIRGKNITINVEAKNIPFTLLYVDVSRFEQVFMNVFGNAVKFTPAGGQINLTIKNIIENDEEIWDELIIEDNGIGMSSDFLPHIFEAFSQENASTTGTTQGTGLGMAITKQIVQLMGGTIKVESELGKGTTFIITLKLPKASKEQIEKWNKDKTNIKESIELVGKRLLLCEDHPLNTKIVIRLLEAKGIVIEHAKNGQIGVEMFKQSRPGYYDGILMDIRMPVMDGIRATKIIRALPRDDAKNIPIIAMTANAFEDDIRETKNIGMNSHLSKPIKVDVLYHTLFKLLN